MSETNTENTFDTLSVSRKLQKAGVPRKQAEAQAEVLKDVIHSNLATKKDLADTKLELNTNIENIRKDLALEIQVKTGELKKELAQTDLKIAEVQTNLVKWMASFSIGSAAFIITVIKIMLST